MAKEFLKKKKVEFEEVNVAENEKGRQEMIDKSHQMGVPVIDIDNTIIVGFNRPEIEKTLRIK